MYGHVYWMTGWFLRPHNSHCGHSSAPNLTQCNATQLNITQLKSSGEKRRQFTVSWKVVQNFTTDRKLATFLSSWVELSVDCDHPTSPNSTQLVSWVTTRAVDTQLACQLSWVGLGAVTTVLQSTGCLTDQQVWFPVDFQQTFSRKFSRIRSFVDIYRTGSLTPGITLILFTQAIAQLKDIYRGLIAPISINPGLLLDIFYW